MGVLLKINEKSYRIQKFEQYIF